MAAQFALFLFLGIGLAAYYALVEKGIPVPLSRRRFATFCGAQFACRNLRLGDRGGTGSGDVYPLKFAQRLGLGADKRLWVPPSTAAAQKIPSRYFAAADWRRSPLPLSR